MKNLKFPKIVGRVEELNDLESFYNHDKPGLVAIYGRRRIGKTYLINEFLNIKEKSGNLIIFKVTGAEKDDDGKPSNKDSQIISFLDTIKDVFNYRENIVIDNWTKAFNVLFKAIKSQSVDKKIVLFIDEFPFFENKKSGFISAFSHFWNNYLDNTNYSHVKTILCGSVTSVMRKKVILAKKGLYRRGRPPILLKPFSLKEVEEFLVYIDRPLERQEIIKLYMATGGVADYLELIRDLPASMDADDIIESLFFGKFKNSFLNEFNLHFKASFNEHTKHKLMVEKLAGSKKGLTRTELLKKCKLTSSGKNTDVINDLLSASLICEVPPLSFDTRVAGDKDLLYKLSDEFFSFYIYWIKKKKIDSWKAICDKPDYNSWTGDAYEKLISKHIGSINSKIKVPLNTPGVWWREQKGTMKRAGPECDLVIKKGSKLKDPVFIIEAKFCAGLFNLPHKYDEKLMNKVNAVKTFSKNPKLQVFLLLITTRGINYPDTVLQRVKKQVNTRELTGEDLFD